jgi:hypothetical protein
MTPEELRAIIDEAIKEDPVSVTRIDYGGEKGLMISISQREWQESDGPFNPPFDIWILLDSGKAVCLEDVSITGASFNKGE